ncbi:transposon polyprotein [Trichonephila clavipes]|nr:transposon polyprotein [Trichonephila clavipes]
MERKFKNNPDFGKQYKEFMKEYESLGHMSLVNSRSHTSKDQNFLPHHAVIKPSSPTTKLRVVLTHLAKLQMVSKAFNAINYLTVPRWVILTADNIVELHGFADASSLAYAAAIYCRQKHNGKIKVQLLVSKTKVAPVKQVSIPRLSFLSWLSGHPRHWKTFVANRTSEIIEILPTKHWRHVPSKENPADIASRGIDPKCLPDCKLWWQGPPWLRLETSSWPKAESSCDEASDEVKAEQNQSPSSICLLTHQMISRGASFNLQPQRSLGVATEHQTGLLEEVELEFISSLQPRKKWQDAQPNLKEDDIVLIKEEGPPGTWPMARVLQRASRQRRTGSCCNCEKPKTQCLNDLFINFTNFPYIRTSSDIGVGVCFLHSSLNCN